MVVGWGGEGGVMLVSGGGERERAGMGRRPNAGYYRGTVYLV